MNSPLCSVYESGTGYSVTTSVSPGSSVGSGVLVGSSSTAPVAVGSPGSVVSSGTWVSPALGVLAMAVSVAWRAISLRFVVGVTGGGVERIDDSCSDINTLSEAFCNSSDDADATPYSCFFVDVSFSCFTPR